MGTINHKSSDYITLASPHYSYSDFENDHEFLDEHKDEIEEYGLDKIISLTIYDYLESDRDNIETVLNKYDFHFFRIDIEPGYYDGFSLQIELNVDTIHDKEDKRIAQKEITQIKQCLIECAGTGMQACFPGWCTSYFDYTETCKMINSAVKEMRQAVRETETDYTYWHNRKAV